MGITYTLYILCNIPSIWANKWRAYTHGQEHTVVTRSTTTLDTIESIEIHLKPSSTTDVFLRWFQSQFHMENSYSRIHIFFPPPFYFSSVHVFLVVVVFVLVIVVYLFMIFHCVSNECVTIC